MELRVDAGNAAGASLSVDDELVIGRSAGPPGDLGGDPSLSRRHALLRRTPDGLVVEDLGSTNGTFVNGERVSSPRVLAPGDVLEVGDSAVRVSGPVTGAQATQMRPTPAMPPAAAAPPPSAGPPPAPPQVGTPQAAGAAAPAQPFSGMPMGPGPAGMGGAGGGPKAKRDPRVPILAALVVLLAAAAAVGFLTGGSDDEGAGTKAASSSAVPADTTGWVYVVSNNGPKDLNSVVAVDYRKDGSITPAHIREFPTKGTGGNLVLGKSTGTLAGDSQVTISADRRFLFAVNQGSDTVAVFRIDQATGDLQHVEGSPFPSGGKAPATTGFNGRHLVVVNRGILPAEPPPGDPEKTNYTTFSVSDDGALKQIASVPAPGSAPTAAHFAPNGKVMFGNGFYDFKIHSFTIGDDGKLSHAPGSPGEFPDSIIRGVKPGPGEPPEMRKLGYGVISHPSKPFVYYLAAGSARIATYRYDENTGELTFVSQVDNPDTIAECWAAITRDGRFLYTGNSGSMNVSVFRISDDGEKLTRIQLERSQTRSSMSNLALNQQEKLLYVLGTADSPDFPLPPEAKAPANVVEAFAVGSDGKIEPRGAVALPIPVLTLPVGLAVLPRKSED